MISGRYSSTAISKNEEKNFSIRKKENDDSRYAITWTIKTSHASPLMQHLTPSPSSSLPASTPEIESEKVVESGLPSKPMVGIDSARVSTENDRPFDASAALASASSWQVQLNVQNDSQYSWNLDEKGLESGSWKREPQMELKPYSRSTWFCLPSFAGAIGYAKYHCNNAPNVIFFAKWTAKVLSAPQVDAIVHGPSPPILDSEFKVFHTTDCIIVDVTIFEAGSFRSEPQEKPLQFSHKEEKLEVHRAPSSFLRTSPIPFSSVSLKVFRLPIEVLVEREARGTQVPWLVESICDWLVTEHCTTRGLFAQGGRYHQIKALKAYIESGAALKSYEESRTVPWSNFSPSTTISILKLFLRELPVSLIPISQVPQFISLESQDSASSYADTARLPTISTPHPTSSIPSSASTSSLPPSASNAYTMATLRSVSRILADLPPIHKATLIFIAQSLKELWKAPASVHTLDSLCIVFAPIIAPDKPDGSLKSTLPAISAFSTLIQFIDKVPEVRLSAEMER